MKFLVHETYTHEDIKYSGRVAVHKEKDGSGLLMIDAVESLRRAETEFSSSFIYVIPFNCDKLCSSQAKIFANEFDFPKRYIKQLKKVAKIPGNPNVDFEIYNDGTLFFHDMFLGFY